MRYLGIDFGSKRVGLAVSDQSNSFALPLSVLPNSPDLIEKISHICLAHSIGVIIIGESKNFDMQDNGIMEEIRAFVKILEDKLKMKVILHPEFLTSTEAERLQGKNNMLDASAAALILKSYLDTLQHNSNKQYGK